MTTSCTDATNIFKLVFWHLFFALLQHWIIATKQLAFIAAPRFLITACSTHPGGPQRDCSVF